MRTPLVRPLIALLCLAAPWAATARDDDAPWPREGLALRVDAAGPWIAGVLRVVHVRAFATPTPFELRPLAGAEVEVALRTAEGVTTRSSAETDARGSALVRCEVPDTTGHATVSIRARRGNAGRSLDGEVEIVDARVAHVRTDRSLYEPGDEVGVRLLVAHRADLTPRASESVAVAVTASDGAPVLEELLTTSTFGIASTRLALSPRAHSGSYQVVARAPDGGVLGSASFLVATRVLPRFRVTFSTDRGYVAPAGALRGRVRATYLHGPPVQGGVARILDDAGTEIARAVLDRDGAADLPLTATANGSWSLRADVRAPDGTTASAHANVVVDPEPFQLAVEPEAGPVVEGLPNRVRLRVTRPDGSRVRGSVELTVASDALRARIGEDGAADVTLLAGRDALQHASGPCASLTGWIATVRVVPDGDAPWQTERCLEVAPGPGLILRAPAAVAPRDAVIPVEVIAPSTARDLVAEAFWGGAPVGRATLRREGNAQRGVIRLPSGLVGPIAVQARAKADEQTIASALRTVRIEPRALRVEVESSGEELRPRRETSLRVHVRDDAGRGVRSALAVAIVDEASELAAAVPVPPPAAEVMTGTEPPAPADDDPWSDPEARRQELVDEVVPDLFRSIEQRLAGQGPEAVGLFAHGRWAFRRELLRVIGEEAGTDDLVGLDGRPLRPEDLGAVDPHFSFDAVAARVTRSRLVHLLVALRSAALEHGADLRIVPSLDLAALRDDLEDESRDGWGRSFFVRRSAHPRFVLSRALEGWEIGSPGPNGVVGDGDDWVDPMRAPVPKDSPYGVAVGEPGGGPELASHIVADELLTALEQLVAPSGTLSGLGSGGSGMGYGRGAGGLHGLGAGSVQVRASRAEPTVRDRFPQTLLWLAELVTDDHGDVAIPVELADSLTTWRVHLLASALDGAIGEKTDSLVVSQPLFVDVAAPPAWTEGDRIAVPVAVHNHTGADRDLAVRIETTGALAVDGPAETVLHVPEGAVGMERMLVVARGSGPGTLEVSASGAEHSDAARRTVRVLPAAREAQAGKSGVLEGEATLPVELPARALPGTGSLRVRVHAGFASVAMDGLESLLREPNGCFEQTSSSTYPNLLVLAALERSHAAAPEVIERAKKLVGDGYDKLRSFEVRGGGFSWFGEDPANLVLTAYGLRELSDMSKVHPVDTGLLARTRAYLLGRQRADGSWSEPNVGIPEGVTNEVAAIDLRTTAYVAWSLAQAGRTSPQLEAAGRWLRRQRVAPTDRYGLALVAKALAAIDARDTTARARLGDLVGPVRPGRGAIRLDGGRETGVMHGRGDALDVELTALATLSATGLGDPRASRLAAALVEAREGSYGWGTTQATVLSLQSLLGLSATREVPGPVRVAVEVDGRAIGTVELSPDRLDRPGVVSLDRLAPGSHTVRLRSLAGASAPLLYDAAVLWQEPWDHRPSDRGLAVRVDVDRTPMHPDDMRRLTVRVQNQTSEKIDMLMARVGIPSGFEVDEAPLEPLQRRGRVSMVENTGRTVDVYLPSLDGNATLELPLRLVARHPGRVSMPATTAYAYYDPDLAGSSPPVTLTVVR